MGGDCLRGFLVLWCFDFRILMKYCRSHCKHVCCGRNRKANDAYLTNDGISSVLKEKLVGSLLPFEGDVTLTYLILLCLAMDEGLKLLARFCCVTVLL